MKSIAPLRLAAFFVLLAFAAAPLRAQSVTYENVTVTGTGVFQGPSTAFGNWSEGSGSPAGLTLNFTDGTTTAVNFVGSGTSTVWQWSQYYGSGTPSVSLKLDQNNQLILYTSGTAGTAGITLNPASSGTSTFAGSMNISGTDNELPNQVLVSGSSILTQNLGDGRYLLLSATSGFVSSSNLAVGTGTSGGTTGPAYALLGGTATGPNSFAIDGATASGNYSIAMGNNATASGYYSLANGFWTTASGVESTALGNSSIASGSGSTTTGAGAVASGYQSTASGFQSLASGPASSAIGYQAQATGDHSTAVGFASSAYNSYSTSLGYNSLAGDHATSVGFQSNASGGQSVTLGDYSTGSGYATTTLGYSAATSTDFSQALGIYSSATGYQSTAFGAYSTATGIAATALGQYSNATGNFSVAAGPMTSGSGFCQFVVGQWNIPQGNSGSWVGTDNLFIVGNGTSGTSASNAFVVNQNGDTNVSGAMVISGTSGNLNKITNGGLIVTGSAVTSGSTTTYVTTGTGQLLLIPQQGDVSMGGFTAGATPQ